MAGDLTDKDKKQLEKWIGGRQKFELLYKITRDGCSNATFHNLCNNKGPTVTVLYNTNQTVFGGYTSVSWNSGGNYIHDNNAFLFRLNYNGQFQPMKYQVSSPTNAIYGNASYGPTFGSGHDLYTFNGTINKSGTYYALNGGLSVGSGYNMQGHTAKEFANSSLQVTELEVYSVEEFPYNYPLEKPWRKSQEWNTRLMQELKESIETYKPMKELKIPQAKILLIGQVGAGKSSFFNTINSIFRGYITSQACSGNAEHSLTTVYRQYQIRNDNNGKPLNFRLCDTRGLEEDQGLDGHEICYLLDGNIPDRYQLAEEDISVVFKSPAVRDMVDKVSQIIGLPRAHILPLKNYEKEMELEDGINILALLTLKQILHFADDYLNFHDHQPIITC
ncbi:hypothetical protein KUTeg_013915 [Tegillarca granosa]|uniref:TLDc domain-containing protein n=1 Tax=Tegillarca granosa TaxID=220873 RepID=A0ABQ9EYL7_TEGGR|nr:hypothetical protein KUTeg_013915 [Tegillarca granosa]